jgi:hypothetical protein
LREVEGFSVKLPYVINAGRSDIVLLEKYRKRSKFAHIFAPYLVSDGRKGPTLGRNIRFSGAWGVGFSAVMIP